MVNNVFILFQFILRILWWNPEITVTYTRAFSKLYSTEEPLKCIFISWGTPSNNNVCKSEKVDSEKRNPVTANLLSKTLICKSCYLKQDYTLRKKMYYFSSPSRNKSKYRFSMNLKIWTFYVGYLFHDFSRNSQSWGNPG